MRTQTRAVFAFLFTSVCLGVDYTAYILRFLEKLKPDGKPILVIEYGATRNAMLLSVKRTRQFGFLLLLTHRELRTLGKGVSPTGELYGSK